MAIDRVERLSNSPSHLPMTLASPSSRRREGEFRFETIGSTIAYRASKSHVDASLRMSPSIRVA